jgi:hypothetical protein
VAKWMWLRLMRNSWPLAWMAAQLQTTAQSVQAAASAHYYTLGLYTVSVLFLSCFSV